MSIIRRQASNQVLINYLGTAISAVAMIVIYPLELESYGLAQFLMGTAMLMVPFATLGTITAIVKFFPEQKEEAKRKSYLLNMVVIHGAGLMVFFLFFFLFRNTFYDLLISLQFDAYTVKYYSLHLMVATFLVVINRILILHASNYKKIAVPAIYNMLLPKIALPVLILVRHTDVFFDYKFLWLWVGTFFLSTVGLVFYLRRIGALDIRVNFSVLTFSFIRRVMTYSAFTGLGAMATMLANRIDIIMVTLLIGKGEAGVYAIALFIANVLAIPSQAIWSITSPVVADAWEENDRARIRDLYQRTSINLFLFGVLIYFLALGSIDALFQLTSEYDKLVPGVMVFVFLGIAKLVDMMMGINHQIIVYSRLYKYNIFFDLVLGIGNVMLNYYFIQQHGIVGAAIATCISVSIYHFLKMFFIWIAFRMQPFTTDTIKAFAIALISFGVYWVSPHFGHPFVHIILYCGILTIVYFVAMRVFRLENDVIPFIKQRLQGLRARKSGGR